MFSLLSIFCGLSFEWKLNIGWNYFQWPDSRQITLRVNISADHAYSHTYNGRHGRMWKDWYRSKSFKGELDNSIKKTITLLKNIDFPCVCLLIWSKLVKKYRFYSSFGLLSLSVRRAATARGRGKNTTSQLNPPPILFYNGRFRSESVT